METKYPRIALQGMDGLMFVRKQEILYALADGNYTLVYLTDGRMVKVLRKLKEVGQLLSDENFFRIHRSHLINLEHVVKFNADDSGSVAMSNRELLTVARNRKMAFIEKFTRILQSGYTNKPIENTTEDPILNPFFQSLKFNSIMKTINLFLCRAAIICSIFFLSAVLFSQDAKAQNGPPMVLVPAYFFPYDMPPLGSTMLGHTGRG